MKRTQWRREGASGQVAPAFTERAPQERDAPEMAPYSESIETFVRACPGPALAIRGLRLVAHQPIAGIPGLEPEPDYNGPGQESSRLRTIKDVAGVLFCSADHLAREARRYGYSISLAIRWITFLQGYALREHGARGARIADRLGLSDAASWSRFVKTLTGKTPTQLPRLPLRDWAVEARRQAFIVPYSVTGRTGRCFQQSNVGNCQD